MPRLPVDGKRVVEHRITLGNIERDALKSLATSYRIDALTGDKTIVETIGDSKQVFAMLAVLGAMLELLGITDVFDFDDEVRVEVLKILDKVKERSDEGAVGVGKSAIEIFTEILTFGITDRDFVGTL